MGDLSLLFPKYAASPAPRGEALRLLPGNLEAGGGAITPKIGGGAALLLLPQFNTAAGACSAVGPPAVLMIAGMAGPGSRPLPGRLPGALPAARYHPLGVEQDRAGLDELGRIPSKQKEKEALWLT
jgi:hypothetical protein